MGGSSSSESEKNSGALDCARASAEGAWGGVRARAEGLECGAATGAGRRTLSRRKFVALAKGSRNPEGGIGSPVMGSTLRKEQDL